ncbi:ubiquitin-like autophagy protein Apg12-domain-containing protein [Scheffersomyces amazonensis]|uniref:ubiquitin-like autophagy protein Apg12-domain-containing protein n=1 Tax=Scheffersomyces amazonensis TaxID=1078765 RepID=UPI00315CD8B3
MSTIIHSEPDDDSSSESSSDRSNFIEDEKPAVAKIPLSTSVILDRLSYSKKQQLDRTINSIRHDTVASSESPVTLSRSFSGRKPISVRTEESLPQESSLTLTSTSTSTSTDRRTQILQQFHTRQSSNVSSETPKITVRFVPIGSTPIIDKKVFTINRHQSVATLTKFLTKKLRLNSVHLYIQSSFSPTPDENLGDLFDSFRTGEELIISYCNTIAFG